MKRIVIILIIMVFYVLNTSAQKASYFHNAQRIELEIDFTKLYSVISIKSTDEFYKIIDGKFEVIESGDFTGKIRQNKNEKNEFKYFIISPLRALNSDEAKIVEVEMMQKFQSSMFYWGLKKDEIDNMYFSNQINIILKSENDFQKLSLLMEEYSYALLEKDEYLENLYVIASTYKSPLKSFEFATKLINDYDWVKVAEPGFINFFKPNCTNDPLFNQQWYLKNTGQNGGTAGVDIKACDAWALTQGNPNITVAVIDNGVEVTHQDLAANIIGTGFDGVNNSSPQVIRGTHGTPCAGLISAASNNQEGISGVSPSSKIMPVSICFTSGCTNNQNLDIQRAINWASNQGADVISNSWGGGQPSSFIDGAINSALMNGRGGRGCSVVFAMGNGNQILGEYPANSNLEIISVGAVDRCGIRSGRLDIIPQSCDPWCQNCRPGSSFGLMTDVVAGGSYTISTDLLGAQGYTVGDYTYFGGTSAACPIVAGVAALMLSENPCLNQQSVHNIICRTAQKIPTYSYANMSGTFREPLGSHNLEVGHGLVNAELAVIFARNYFLQNDIVNNQLSVLYRRIRAGRNVDPLKAVGNYTLQSGSNVSLTATEEIVFEDGFTAESGSKLIAEINPSSPCNHTSQFNKNDLFDDKEKISETNVVEELKMDFNVDVFPNPTSDKIFLQFQSKTSGNLHYQITDLSGRSFIKNYLSFTKGNSQHEIDYFNTLSQGIYLVNINNGSTQKTFKIIKND